MFPPDPARVHLCECGVCQAGSDPVIQQHHERINLLLSRLTEPQRRWYVGTLAAAPESPGVRQLARITGLDPKTIRRGRREVETGLPDLPTGRQRRVGAGAPTAEKKIRNWRP
ncbi:hypothetical protein [Candidatus Chloroploca sp. Khr17]|uniref:hypothetical protein n=1 Tax=Candidatus Chloroploca sp. Khr17 TaxID=2496869 RepID=UPI00101C3789|nr:hypothetical protein [Candidatus Chloroploca sp. Khr17]NCC34957.1 hypothetical protein [Chloroflexia bacterium]